MGWQIDKKRRFQYSINYLSWGIMKSIEKKLFIIFWQNWFWLPSKLQTYEVYCCLLLQLDINPVCRMTNLLKVTSIISSSGIKIKAMKFWQTDILTWWFQYTTHFLKMLKFSHTLSTISSTLCKVWSRFCCNTSVNLCSMGSILPVIFSKYCLS